MSESEYMDICEQLSRGLAKAGELIAKLGGWGMTAPSGHPDAVGRL